jgi:hypothetical protein
MFMIRVQVLEWVQGKIQDLILNNVITYWPVYNDDMTCTRVLPLYSYHYRSVEYDCIVYCNLLYNVPLFSTYIVTT